MFLAHMSFVCRYARLYAALIAILTVLRGNCESAASHPGAALLLIYPPPDTNMAEDTLRAFLKADGQVVAYVGEWAGDTATPFFERALSTAFMLQSVVPLPNWGESRACLMVWRRTSGAQREGKSAARVVGSPLACGVCGETSAAGASSVPTSGSSSNTSSRRQLWRCRLTGVLRCSEACALAGARTQSDEAALRLAVVPPPISLSLSGAPVSAGSLAAWGLRTVWRAPAYWVHQ